MNNEMENYIGELKELRKIASHIKDKQIFIEKHIQWLDSDIRLGAFSDWDKINKKEMKEFLEKLLCNS